MIEGERVGACSLVSSILGVKGACWSSKMGTRKIGKQVNYSHEPTQTKQQVGQCVGGTFLVHGGTMGKHGLIIFTKARTWGKPPPSPLQYSLCLATRPTPKCHLVSGLPSWKITRVLILGISHNFVCKPLIKVRSKTKLQPLSIALQRYVARHLHVRKLGRFLTFNDQE